MKGKFVLKSTGKGKFSFNLQAGNKRTVLSSESYKSKSPALAGIESVRKNGGKDGNFERRKAKNGQPYFVLKARNLEVIGHSQIYASSRSMEKGIASVKANVGSPMLEDLTDNK